MRQSDADVQKDTDVQEEVVVLGTRRTDRSVTDSASPVDVIGATELATQPAADMLEVLKNVVPASTLRRIRFPTPRPLSARRRCAALQAT